MESIKLIVPTTSYRQDIWQFRQEILDSQDANPFAGCGTLRVSASAQAWIDDVHRTSNAESCPEDKVPSDVYLALRESDNRIVGVIDLRHHIDHPILGTWGGHIGYTVRPSERGKGYGKEMLKQLIPHARRLGIKALLVTCDAKNIPSEKVILANGGILEKEITVEGNRMKRYWITV